MDRDCWKVATLALLVAPIAVWPGPASARTVALFEDPAFVDSGSGSVSAEADNLRAALESLGHTVVGYVGTSATAIGSALALADVAIIPELENADLAAALGEAARDAYRAHVESGGGLIVAATSGMEAAGLLNQLFGWSLTTGAVGPGMLTTAALETAYRDGPAMIAENSRSRGIDVTSLPADTLPVYINGSRANVARFVYGSGRVAYLGWDWFDAAPVGSQDGGWLAVLGRAVIDTGECRDTSGGDLDDDGISDACDPVEMICADVDGARELWTAPRVILRQIGSDNTTGNDGLTVSGAFELPDGRQFGSLDPQSRPVVLVLQGPDGAVLFSVALRTDAYGGSGTVGWRRGRSGRRWKYFDETMTPAGGIVSAVLRDRSQDAPRRLAVSIKGKNATYPIEIDDRPLTVIVVVGDPRLGECARTSFLIGDCKVGRGGSRLRCSGP